MGIHATLMLAPGWSPRRPQSEPKASSPDAVRVARQPARQALAQPDKECGGPLQAGPAAGRVQGGHDAGGCGRGVQAGQQAKHPPPPGCLTARRRQRR